MPQDIKEIDINDLVLWTENPRDPIKATATDQYIAERAISNDGRSRWSIKKLFISMGNWYDNSEIPTVVYVNGKPVVYDGNRRVLIGKIIHKCVKVKTDIDFSNFDFSEKIPCNICDKKTALKNVERKHAKGGSWKALERDIFKHKHMGEDKSAFLVIDEATGIISDNTFMNQDFVKEEIFSTVNLKDLNISVEDGVLKTPYTSKELKEILFQIIDLVYNKDITTRKSRRKLTSLFENADSTVKDIISNNKGNLHQPYLGPIYLAFTPRTPKKEIPLFGKKLNLKSGIVNNLYRDLRDMHDEWEARDYSEHFPMIIGIGLRLLCEVAEAELNPQYTTKLVQHYIKKYFDDAKNARTKKEREFFNTNSLSDLNQNDMISLLQKSGHPSSDTMTNGQTIVLSIILGKILEKTHGAETSK